MTFCFFFYKHLNYQGLKAHKLHYLKIRKFSSDKQEVIGRSEGKARQFFIYGNQ